MEAKTKQMTFQEYWQHLEKTDKIKFWTMRKLLREFLEWSDSNLRRRKRDNRFKKSEKIVIAKLISEFEENPEITEKTLFPNSLEKQADNFYNTKYKKFVNA